MLTAPLGATCSTHIGAWVQHTYICSIIASGPAVLQGWRIKSTALYAVMLHSIATGSRRLGWRPALQSHMVPICYLGRHVR